jgi:hypothetical protein
MSTLRRTRAGALRFLAFLAIGSAMLAGTRTVSAQGQQDPLERAMRDEMARTMAKLQLAELDKPYFVAYRVREGSGVSASASFGALNSSGVDRLGRSFSVEVRVGDYSFDDSNFSSMGDGFGFSMGVSGGMDGSELPQDGDYLEFRRQLWLATDATYKQALEIIAAKRAALQNVTQTEPQPDFSKEEPLTLANERPPIELNRAAVEALARKLSGVFRTLPNVYNCTVSVAVSNHRSLYLNSEGTFVVHSAPLIEIHAAEQTQATDGMPLGDSFTVLARSTDELPSSEVLTERIRTMAMRLDNLRSAPLLARYNGPVLFEKDAAAELFAETFAPALIAHRSPVGGNAGMDAFVARMTGRGAGASFQDKVGGRVLPEWMSVTDNATLTEFSGARLMGGYKADSQGVRGRETVLISDGILKTLLNGRTPVPGILKSTGNERGGKVMPSNLIVQTDKSLSSEGLKQELLRRAGKRNLPFAIVVRKIGSSANVNPGDVLEGIMAMAGGMGGVPGEQRKSVLLAYKAFADGHEELVRGVELAGLNAESFKEILAAGTDDAVYTTTFGGSPFSEMMSSFMEAFGVSGREFTGPIVSYVVPALLFEDVTFSRPPKELPKPPYTVSPSFSSLSPQVGGQFHN